jgi:hypothetical protein
VQKKFFPRMSDAGAFQHASKMLKGARLCAEHLTQQRKKTRAFCHPIRRFQETVLRLAFGTAALRDGGQMRPLMLLRKCHFYDTRSQSARVLMAVWEVQKDFKSLAPHMVMGGVQGVLPDRKRSGSFFRRAGAF